MFPLTASKIAYVVNMNLMPIASPTTDEDPMVMAERKKRKENEVLYHGHISNTLPDQLYNLFTSVELLSEIWRVSGYHSCNFSQARHFESEHQEKAK